MPAYDVQAENQRGILAATQEVESTASHGEVDVRQADSWMPHCEVYWRDHPLVVSWRVWLCDAAQLTTRQRELLPATIAAAADPAAERHGWHLDILGGVWKRASEVAISMPILLDMTGLPLDTQTIMRGCEAVIRRANRGTTLMVSNPHQSWVWARCLPRKVG